MEMKKWVNAEVVEMDIKETERIPQISVGPVGGQNQTWNNKCCCPTDHNSGKNCCGRKGWK